MNDTMDLTEVLELHSHIEHFSADKKSFPAGYAIHGMRGIYWATYEQAKDLASKLNELKESK